jgi:hypothetical protein
MASKISNGELSQENVIKDAMKFASVIPGMFGGAAGAKNAGNSGASNLNNMTAMMNMMNMMMNANKGGDGEMPDLSALFNKKQSNGTKTAVNKGALKKLAKMKQLQAKLAKRRGEDS